MNWSRSVRKRSAFLAPLCPTSETMPIWPPSCANTAYSLVSSISFRFWLTKMFCSVIGDRYPPATGPPTCMFPPKLWSP